MSKSYSSMLSWFGLILAASLMLYHTSDRVTALNRQLHDVNAQIESEQTSLHVLKAEWVYLANPARVEAEAKRHLTLQPTPTSRVIAMNDTTLASLLPLSGSSGSAFAAAPAAPSTQVADAATSDTVNLKSFNQPTAMPHRTDHTIAAINDGHINDHVILQHGVATQASTDTIGGLINSLSLHP